MPRITFYISDEDKKAWYDEFKKIAGESSSSFFVDAIKKEVLAKQREVNGMVEHIIPDGLEDQFNGTASIKHLKFVGKIIAECTDNRIDIDYTVYLTRKGKLLVHSVREDEDHNLYFSHKVYEKQVEFMSAGYPPELVKQVVNNLPKVECIELDV